jgi:hypothetical protein
MRQALELHDVSIELGSGGGNDQAGQSKETD